tara:strand:- start:161 stop:1183 length:1023 start_codon:yes stop_codon:yes gene_type:complete
MNPILLQIIEPLENDVSYEVVIDKGSNEFIYSGYLLSKPSMRRVPIINDIPNFEVIENVSHPQKETYNFWWNESHKNYEYDEENNKKILLRTIKISENDYENSKVLDLGCGNGRFSDIVSKCKPSLLVLFDISDGIFNAYSNAKKNCENVIAIKGNILSIPIKEEFFDIVYSWGVLHHTGDTKQAFAIASRLVNANGKLGIYVYASKPEYRYNNTGLRLLGIFRQLLVINTLRYISTRLPGKFVIYLFKPIYYFEKFINFGIVGCHGSGIEKFNKDDYFRRVIDRFKTRYATEHSIEEVIGWYLEENFKSIFIGDDYPVSLTGVKNKLEKEKIEIILKYK